MSIETPAPVFSLKGMKRAFFIFLTFNILITVTAVIMFALFDPLISTTSINDLNPWHIFFMYIGLTIISIISSKRMVKYIRETADPAIRFSRYESFYKRKTLANVFGIAITAILCVVTAKYGFFFLLSIQLIVPITLYPRKKMLATLFQNDEVKFA